METINIVIDKSVTLTDRQKEVTVDQVRLAVGPLNANPNNVFTFGTERGEGEYVTLDVYPEQNGRATLEASKSNVEGLRTLNFYLPND